MRPPAALHRVPIVAALLALLWIGGSASRFSFWDYKYECVARDLCNYADVISGMEQHWTYFIVAAALLAVGIALHIWRGRTPPAHTRPASLLLLLSPALMWVMYLPVGFVTMFSGRHLMAAAACMVLIGAVWLASESLGAVRGARQDLAACYLAVALGVAATRVVWETWPEPNAAYNARLFAAWVLGAAAISVVLAAYKGLSWSSVVSSPRSPNRPIS